jgi:hypothetical protein
LLLSFFITTLLLTGEKMKALMLFVICALMFSVSFAQDEIEPPPPLDTGAPSAATTAEPPIALPVTEAAPAPVANPMMDKCTANHSAEKCEKMIKKCKGKKNPNKCLGNLMKKKDKKAVKKAKKAQKKAAKKKSSKL